MPRVSINLCCYNSEPFLEETLASVFAQTYRDYELVVVNDGSRDRTEEIVRRHAAAGRPIVYRAQPNAGLGRARNAALALSSGELIAILDHDDVWDPRKLERQVPLFDRPEVGFAASDALFIDARGRTLGRYSADNPLQRGSILRPLVLYNFIPCAAVVMRRGAIDGAGGFFRPDFRISEEYELFLRLAARSEFDFSPEPLVRIRVHAASAGWDFAREREENRRIYEECFAREPALARSLGPDLLALKRAGLWVRPDLADALAGRPAGRRAALAAALLVRLARWNPALVDRLREANRAVRRWKAAFAA